MEYSFIYFLYLAASLFITIIVGNSLHRNGGIWIQYLLNGDITSNEINNLLLLAYRLLNIGYIVFTLMNAETPNDLKTCIAFFGNRMGFILLILSFLHFQNILILLIFSHYKNNKKCQT